MKQEDFNSMMRLPCDSVRKRPVWAKCPKCGENYCGDGKSLCADCKSAQKPAGGDA